jgi:hypothetical protein
MSLSQYKAIAESPRADRRPAGSVPASSTTGDTVSSSFGFNGATQPQCGCYPSDSNGAVSSNQIAETVNESLVVYNKSGSLLSSRTFPTISGYTTEAQFDPRIVYDANWKRFVISLDAFPESGSTQYELVLISKTSSATGGFIVYKVNVAPFCGSASSGPFWDYPQLGQTQDAVVITANCFNSSGYAGARVFALAKALIYNKQGFSVPVFAPSAGNGTVTPANVLDQNPNMYLISTAQHMLTLQDPQGAFYGSMPADRAISGFEPRANPRLAGQAGCTATSCELDTSDGRFENDSTQFGDQLWNVATYGLGGTSGSFATPYWGQFSIAGASTTQFGSAIADACSDDFNASLVVSTAGKMWINWTSTDPQGSSCGGTFVRQFLGGRTSATPSGVLDNKINPFTSGAELTGDFDSGRGFQRWGDTSSMSLDGASTAWSINNSVADSNDWGTRIQKVTQ